MTVVEPGEAFEWAQAPWGRVLRCRSLLSVADHFFTTADLQLRRDACEWDAVASFAGVDRDQLRLLHQVHGRTVLAAAAGEPERPEADGIISRDRRDALVVRVADCAPVLIGDRRLGAVAAVHAGWRSTMQSIALAAVRALSEAYGSRPQDLVVAIGPSLGACCGEMGDEVVDAFRAYGHKSDAIDRWFLRAPGRRPYFDLWSANCEQLQAAGVPASSIHVSGLCTRTHPDLFHSYRAHGTGAGRMAAVIRARGRVA